MIYLLDTNTLNYVLKKVPAVVDRFAAAVAVGADFVLCPVVHYEATRYYKLKNAARLLREYQTLVSDWTWQELAGPDWDTAADLWARRHRAGSPIEDADLLIAVTALKTGAILVTNNPAHFQDLGVALENWA